MHSVVLHCYHMPIIIVYPCCCEEDCGEIISTECRLSRTVVGATDLTEYDRSEGSGSSVMHISIKKNYFYLH